MKSFSEARNSNEPSEYTESVKGTESLDEEIINALNEGKDLTPAQQADLDAYRKKNPKAFDDEGEYIGEGGLWDNIHKKRKRIKNGSKEKMRPKGDPDRPTAKDFKDSQ